jgi:SecD/SecF fusion protein
VKERRNNLILIALILAALVGSALLAIPGSPLHRSPVLGLDLQGGFEVVLKAVPPAGRPLQESDINRSVEIIRNRVDKLGVAEPEIRKQGDDQIAVALPGVDNPDRVRDVIGSTAKLELYDLQDSATGPSINAQGEVVASESRYDLLRSAATQSLVERFGSREWYAYDEDGKLVAGPYRTKAAIENAEKVKGVEGVNVYGVPNGTVVITCGPEAGLCPPGIQPSQDVYYLFKHRPNAEEPIPQLTGEDLRLNGTRQDFDTQGGNQPIVTMQFTDAGGDKFQDVTRELHSRGRLRGQPQQFAIVLDRAIQSWPQIDPTDATLSDGIGGGRAQIEGNFTVQEAQDLALVLQTGALPVEFQTLSETEVSATLGEDSLKQALRAAVIGLLVVAIFLLIFYRFLGLVAVFGLAIYALLLYAMILLFDVTLTLPGFAGLILTIGIAADANIVIFERIKEEARLGKGVRAAISTGYAKGFATIIDANVVTAITAVILFVLASSGVRGFAFMLLLGTAVSIVTAVFATRALLGLLSGFRWFNNPAFMGATAREIPRWQRIDVVGRRRIWFAISSVLIVLSLISIAVLGLNLGIDFRGGTQTEFTSTQPVALADIRAEASRLGQGNAVIQGVGESVDGAYRDFVVKTEPIEPEEQRQLVGAIERETGATAEGGRTVSASFSGQILRSAIYAMLLAFLLISIYITIRFQWRFAVPILRTIVNDGVIAVGVYSISGREVTAGTVAAFLTIIGYSIYDTIIIFDRVRENLQLMRRSAIKHIINVSLWETIPRSLATTFITLLPVSVMYFFGGETLKDFAFAILIGIGISAFSTIFIAAPFLSVLLERAPEYRGRTETVADEKQLDLGPAPVAAGGDGDGAAPVTPPTPVPAPPRVGATVGTTQDKREQRRQRRRSRPHGRAR